MDCKQAAEKGCEVALRAPRGQMRGDATKAMPRRIGEERQQSRWPRAVFGCGGRVATGSREVSTGPAGAKPPFLKFSAAVRVANAFGRKPDRTPASIFQQPAR